MKGNHIFFEEVVLLMLHSITLYYLFTLCYKLDNFLKKIKKKHLGIANMFSRRKKNLNYVEICSM